MKRSDDYIKITVIILLKIQCNFISHNILASYLIYHYLKISLYNILFVTINQYPPLFIVIHSIKVKLLLIKNYNENVQTQHEFSG